MSDERDSKRNEAKPSGAVLEDDSAILNELFAYYDDLRRRGDDEAAGKAKEFLNMAVKQHRVMGRLADKVREARKKMDYWSSAEVNDPYAKQTIDEREFQSCIEMENIYKKMENSTRITNRIAQDARNNYRDTYMTDADALTKAEGLVKSIEPGFVSHKIAGHYHFFRNNVSRQAAEAVEHAFRNIVKPAYERCRRAYADMEDANGASSAQESLWFIRQNVRSIDNLLEGISAVRREKEEKMDVAVAEDGKVIYAKRA